MPCFWKSFRNICVYLFTLALANSGRGALCWKCRTACFFQLSVPPPPAASNRKFGVAETNPLLREGSIVPKQQRCRQHLVPGRFKCLRGCPRVELLNTSKDESWDLENEFKFCERLVKWQEVRCGVFAVACIAEDTHCGFLCLFLCIQGSSLPKPEHRALFSKSKLAVLLMPPWPGSSLQHRYGRAECIHHAEIGSHVLTVFCCVTQSCLGSDLLFSPNKQQPLMRRGVFPPPAPCYLVTSKL